MFVWDVWFHHQIVYTSIEHPSIINKMMAYINFPIEGVLKFVLPKKS